jgi:LPXTG-site transpeptidase (sortase) family protein
MRVRHTHKTKQRPPLFWIVFSVGLLFMGQLFLFNRVQSNSLPYVANAEPVSQQKMPSGLPITITIPAIGVNAVIADAGLKADGTMDIKKDPDQVAWYEFGTRPGDEGSAVIAGHSGWTGLHGSVFNDIYKLTKGDTISVLDQTGSTKTFVVTGSKEYSPTADATSVFQSYDGKAHLNLVTCDGVWVNATDSRSSRLVVFADLQE